MADMCGDLVRCSRCGSIFDYVLAITAKHNHTCRNCGVRFSDMNNCKVCGATLKDGKCPVPICSATKKIPLDIPVMCSCGVALHSWQGSCSNCGALRKSGAPVVAEKPGLATQCGCGRHMVSLTGDKVVCYKDKWWLLRCLFYRVDKRMPRLVKKLQMFENDSKAYRKIRTKFIKMKNILRTMPCAACGHNAGNRFHLDDGRLYCGTCGHNGVT